MKVIWTKSASLRLQDIFTYYEKEAGRRIAKKIITNIFEATAQLERFPFSGAMEQNLIR